MGAGTTAGGDAAWVAEVRSHGTDGTRTQARVVPSVTSRANFRYYVTPARPRARRSAT